MNQKNHSADNIPKLRFPEFLDLDAWEEKLLESLSLRISDGIHTTPIYDDKGEYYFINGNNLVGGIIEVNEATKKVSEEEYKKHKRDLGQNTILLSINGTIGNISVYNNEKVVLGKSACYINIDNKKANKYFIIYFLHTKKVHNFFLSELTGSTIMNLSLKTVKNTIIDLPSRYEQQKIADCLTSIADLITAQSQKLDALKTHKKGLMQQLFPFEGETAPKLRFAEFRGKGEWEEKKFGELCKFTRGPFGGALKKEIFVKDGYAVYEQSHAIHKNFDSFRYYISEEKFNELKRFSVLPDDIIMSCSGTMGKFAIVPRESKKGIINQALLKLTVKKGYDLRFIKATLELPINQEKLLSQSAGGAIKNVVSVDQIKEINLFIPNSKEQQKLADCLSSIDELITAQSQKLDALKVHKKGLMQQLFPVAEVQ